MNTINDGSGNNKAMVKVANDHTTLSDEPLSVSVNCADGVITAKFEDRRPDVEVFLDLAPAQQESLAIDAWTVGLRAVVHAYRSAEEAKLTDIGRSIRDDVGRACQAFVERQENTLTQVLTHYFDPKDGRIVERLEAFLRDGGDLARTMDRYLEPERGMLAQVLAREVGEQSPLLKALDPKESDGIVNALSARIQTAMSAQQVEFGKALDPLSEDGAVSRFLRSLRQELERAAADREKLLTTAISALNANDEGSLISRLMRETQGSRQQLARAMNPELPDSAMGVLKTTVTALLTKYAKEHQDALAGFEEKQLKASQELREIVVRLDERRRHDAKSPRGGVSFQDDVVRFVVAAVRGAPVVPDFTGNRAGSIANCKVGDLVLQLTAESAFPGARVVFEAKREAGSSITKALKELETARGNRGATVGVFVLERSRAGAEFVPLVRHGRDIVVIWDPTDESSDGYLHAAIVLALALASYGYRIGDQGDIAALADVEHRVLKEVERMEKIRDIAQRIEKQSRELQEEVRKGSDKLDLILRKAKSTLRALDVELVAPEQESGAPIALGDESLSNARRALVGADPPTAA